MKYQQEIASPCDCIATDECEITTQEKFTDENHCPSNETYRAKQLASDEKVESEPESKPKKNHSLPERIFFSGALTSNIKLSKKIAYIAVVAAFLSVANMFEFRFADVQFSLSVAISALSGIILGGAFGFVAAFLGDLVGFLYNSSGYAYMPWVGIALGVTALLAGVIVGGWNLKCRGALAIKISVLAVCAFFVCTVGINTTAFWILYAPSTNYFAYAITRIFVKGTIFNCLVNYVLLYILIPLIAKVKLFSFDY